MNPSGKFVYGMDGVLAHETQPLILPVHPQQARHRSLRQRFKLPSQRTLTAAVLILFLLVVVMLLIIQNLTTLEPRVDVDIFPEDFHDELNFLHVMPQNASLRAAWNKGKSLVLQIEELERILFVTGIVPPKRSASWRIQNFLRMRHPSGNVSRCAIVVEHVKRSLGKCVTEIQLPTDCHSPKPCECDRHNRYRTYNGSCNNLYHKTWGMSETAFSRLIDAQYSDGVSSPRISAYGDKLPNARQISTRLYAHKSLPDSNATLLTMNFGLFIDHDIVQIATQNGHNGSAISCCDPRIKQNPSFRHPECLEIDIPDFDCFYNTQNVTCMDFIRSRPIPGKCPGQREQMNLVTAYIDGSAIYGSTDEHAKTLRAFKRGLLLDSNLNGTSLMPVNNDATCGTPKEPLHCFVSGDSRVNEHVDLAAVHNLWFREHNRIAAILEGLNPNWDDERLFQEARRIVIAELQHITYNEFLPLILGDDAMKKYGLSINPNGSSYHYDDNVEGGIYNVFAAAAFRFGHTLIQGLLYLYGKNYEGTGTLTLHKTFLNPKVIFNGGFDNLLRGLVVQPTQSVESYMTTEIRDRLFQPSNGFAGLDLSAFGIQRGRDHGIAGYTAWRKACDLSPVQSWDDMYSLMDPVRVDRMKELYLSIDDVDLIPAALGEHHAKGSMLGPTYQCLLSKQFQRLKYGDRFWYETVNKSWSLTNDQLKEIYQSSMARVICDNADRMSSLQIYALRVADSKTNPITNCTKIPEMDFSKWIESNQKKL